MVKVGQVNSLRGLIQEVRKGNEEILNDLLNGSGFKLGAIQEVHNEICEMYGCSVNDDEIVRIALASVKEFVNGFAKKETKVTKDYSGDTRTIERFIENLGEYTEVDLKYHLKKLIQTKIDAGSNESKSFKEILIEYKNGNQNILGSLFYINKNTYEIKYRIKEIAAMKNKIHKLYQNYFLNKEIDENFHTYLIEFVTQKTITAIADEFTEPSKPIYDDPADYTDEQLREMLYKRILWTFETLTEKQYGRINRPNIEITDEMLSDYADDVEKLKQNPLELSLVKSWIRQNETQSDTRYRSFESANREVTDEEGNIVESDYDEYVMKQYETVSNETDFEKFIRFIEIEDFLNHKQRIIYPYLVERESLRFKTKWMKNEGRTFEPQEKLTYAKIANILHDKHSWKITPQGVKMYEIYIRKIIIEQFLIWKAKTIHTKVPNHQAIREFLFAFKEIEKTVTDRPHYILFKYLIAFLKSNYEIGEQRFSIKQIMKQLDVNETIFDIIADRFNDDIDGTPMNILEKKLNNTYLKILVQLLEGKNIKVSGEQKKRIVNRCKKIFEEYLVIYEKNLHKLMQYMDKMKRRTNEEIVKINQGYYDALRASKVKKSKIS